MLSKVKTCGIIGIDGYVIEVETDISNGIPAFEIVGLGDMAVRESKERVRAAIKNLGLDFPGQRITINLSPANIKKEGSSFDLAIAIGVLLASEQIKCNNLDDYMFSGELSLDGAIKSIFGALSMAVCAKEKGIVNFILPIPNSNEAGVVKGVNILPSKTLKDVVNHLNCVNQLNKFTVDLESLFNISGSHNVDFSDVKGQANVKRALEVAACGSHNTIMIGSPGSGKTMLARRLPTILPPLSFEEAIETTKIHSIVGALPPNTSLITERTFRSPHHTISSAGLIGGGRIPKPGEISLSHYGVLFLDELPEFNRDVLEVMRQPLEDGIVTISRVNGTISYPARTTLICAANPCKCGNFLDKTKQCTCSQKDVKSYLGKLSGPLLDRIDLHIEVASVKYSDLDSERKEETSEEIRKRVIKAKKIQIERYKGLKIYSNAELYGSLIAKYCRLDEKGKALLRDAFERMSLSARAHSRILKVARTIADMDESEIIQQNHIAEAIQYRSLDRKFW